MKVLTEQRGKGYVIAAKDVPDAINKLGRIEHEAFDLCALTCDSYCKYKELFGYDRAGAHMLGTRCRTCPLAKLADLILKEDRRSTRKKEAQR